jgi:hypothetical protein
VHPCMGTSSCRVLLAHVSHCMGNWLVFCREDEGREVHDDQYPGEPVPI